MNILITGAAGNLGGLLAKHLIDHTDHRFHLLIHKRAVHQALKESSKVRVFQGDLAQPETLAPSLQPAELVIHFAGVLFKAKPEKFLPTTNTVYFQNLCAAAVKAGVRNSSVRAKRLLANCFGNVKT